MGLAQAFEPGTQILSYNKDWKIFKHIMFGVFKDEHILLKFHNCSLYNYKYKIYGLC